MRMWLVTEFLRSVLISSLRSSAVLCVSAVICFCGSFTAESQRTAEARRKCWHTKTLLLFYFADCGIKGQGGTADEQEGATDYAGVVWQFAHLRFGNDYGRLGLNVERPVRDYSTGRSDQDADDQEESLHMRLLWALGLVH